MVTKHTNYFSIKTTVLNDWVKNETMVSNYWVKNETMVRNKRLGEK